MKKIERLRTRASEKALFIAFGLIMASVIITLSACGAIK